MATVIKTSQVAAAFHPDELGQTAQQYMDEVRAAAAEVLANAQQQADALRHQAYHEGRAAGLADAAAEIDRRVADELAREVPLARQAVTAIDRARAEWIAHWESAALRVATAIASRVLRREVEREPRLALPLVREALELAAGCDHLQLRMHPADLAVLRPHLEPLVDELARLGECQIVADEQIERGGCRLEMPQGSIDQQFTAQLARIEQELK